MKNDIVTAVLEHAQRRPAALCVACISARTGEAVRTWGELAEQAGRSAAGWRALGVSKGDVVILIGTHHIDFYAAWLGAVWIGAVPTVLAEPSVRIQREIYVARTRALVDRIGAKAVALDPRVTLALHVPESTYAALASSTGPVPERNQPAPDDVLLLQHSSGTTGLQKGVMLTHGAIAAHAASYAEVTHLGEDGVVATWLPLYHDMGLIACFVGPLFAGSSVAWLSPFEWVASPQLLLDVVERFKATHSWLPNFAFLFLAQRAKRPVSLASLRHVVNCSEVVTTEAVDAFIERFAPQGLDARALHTCYAMAENVYAMTSTHAGEPPRRLSVDRDAWRDAHEARDARAASASVVHVSCGKPVPGVSVRVVDDAGAALPARRAGRVLVKSPFLFAGYHARDDLNASIFDANGYFDTGDLGFLDEAGHLYVTGRKKDVIIVAGKNIYPQDVEAVADRIEGVHPGRAVAFGVAVRGMGTDGVVLLAETDEVPAARDQIAQRLRAAVAANLDLDLADLRVVARHELRKSTSGKLARGGNREWYLEGRFGALPDSIAGAGGDA